MFLHYAFKDFFLNHEPDDRKKVSEEFCLCCGYIFLLFRTDLKDFPQHSKRPIVSSVLFPLLSFFPAIFQVFFGLLTSFLQLGHLAIAFTFQTVHLIRIKHFPLKTTSLLDELLADRRFLLKLSMQLKENSKKVQDYL